MTLNVGVCSVLSDERVDRLKLRAIKINAKRACSSERNEQADEEPVALLAAGPEVRLKFVELLVSSGESSLMVVRRSDDFARAARVFVQ